MEKLQHQYHYSKRAVIAKALFNSVLAAALLALGVFCFVHWDLGFMFTDWKGYLMLGVYGLLTLGLILSVWEGFQKIVKAGRGIPAFGVGADRFEIYDRTGLPTIIAFEDCERVRFKREIHFRGAPATLTLIIVYRDAADPQTTKRIEIPLNELDRSQRDIDRELKKIYHRYKKDHDASAT